MRTYVGPTICPSKIQYNFLSLYITFAEFVILFLCVTIYSCFSQIRVNLIYAALLLDILVRTC